MNMFLPLIILVILGCIYAGSLKNPRSRLCTVVCVLLFILVLCYMQSRGMMSEGFSGFGGYAPLDYNMQNGGSNGTGGCGGYDYSTVNSSLSPLTSYDGIMLNSNIATKPLLNSPVIFNNVGDGYILKDAMNSEKFPSIDGQPGSQKSMFILKNNQVSWDCCPSTYGAGMNGCVCPSAEQLRMFGHRGGNAEPKDKEYPGI